MQSKAEELFVEVDEQDQVLGPVARKRANSSPELIHRSIKVFVFDTAGRLLLQRRSVHKDSFPGCWDVSVTGHVDWGESYEAAAVREAEEEIGVDLRPEQLQPMGKLLVRLPRETEFQQSYRVVLGAETAFRFAEDEISEICFVAPEELKEMAKEESSWATPALINLRHYGLL